MITVGIDVGGTKIAGALVSETGNILKSLKVPTPADNTDDLITAVVEMVKELSSGQEVAAVGVAIAGFIDADQSEVIYSPNLSLRNEPLKAKLEARLGIDVFVENDANAAGWAEYKFGEVPYVQYQQDLNTLDVTCVPTDAIDSKMIQFTSNNVEYTIVKDLNKEVVEAFKEWWLVVLYVVAMIAISFHLIHGFKSAFQTMGFNHSKYNGLIRFIGIYVFGIIVPILFAAMPIYFFLNS
jgi:hypothetical protein